MHDQPLDEQSIRRDQLRVLQEQLAHLPDDQREMLVLRYLVGWRVQEIAAHLGMTDNTVSVTIRRTLVRLRRDWPYDEEHI